MEALTQKDIELWLKENTFECPLGRVSINQCEINRSRKPFRRCKFGELPRPIICDGCDHSRYQKQINGKKKYAIN